MDRDVTEDSAASGFRWRGMLPARRWSDCGWVICANSLRPIYIVD